jgi:hypothetical protein
MSFLPMACFSRPHQGKLRKRDARQREHVPPLQFVETAQCDEAEANPGYNPVHQHQHHEPECSRGENSRSRQRATSIHEVLLDLNVGVESILVDGIDRIHGQRLGLIGLFLFTGLLLLVHRCSSCGADLRRSLVSRGQHHGCSRRAGRPGGNYPLGFLSAPVVNICRASFSLFSSSIPDAAFRKISGFFGRQIAFCYPRRRSISQRASCHDGG